MPEGDTIRRLAANVLERLGDRPITASNFRHPRLANLDLSGLRIVDADARGKHLLVRFDDDRTLVAHMLMQGRVRFRRVFDVPEWRRRFEIEFEGAYVTGIDIPKLDLVRRRDELRAIGHLGPDLCGSYDHPAALRRFAEGSARPLGEVMLDQRVVAGFGNIYAVETPFICGISPMQPIDSISDPGRILTLGAGLIRANAARGPQNTTGKRLHTDDHWVIDANKRHCPLCGTRLNRIKGEASPWRRRTAWCPECQPAVARTAVDIERVGRLVASHPGYRLVDIDSMRMLTSTARPVTVQPWSSSRR